MFEHNEITDAFHNLSLFLFCFFVSGCPAADLKPVISTTESDSQGGDSTDKLPDKLKGQLVQYKDWYCPGSRSPSHEPASGSDGSEGSDEGEESPVKAVSKSQKQSSGSASPELPMKKLSKSRSPVDLGKRSGSTSKSTSRKKLSR